MARGDRSNERLNCEIEKKISAWYGTAFGFQLKNMYENGCSYRSICDVACIDPEDYLEEEEGWE